MSGRWTRAAVLVAGAAAVCAAAAATAAARVDTQGTTAAKVVKVGFIYPRTGLLSQFGAEEVQGYKLGLEYVKGKCGGNTIQTTYVDDATDPAKAVAAAKDLIGQGYKILAGTGSSGAALQVAPIADQNQILYISGAAAADAITGINRHTFRAGRQSYQDVLDAAGILPPKSAGKKVVVFA
jgi:branched-chain amino acid transport system substrate-binding protein